MLVNGIYIKLLGKKNVDCVKLGLINFCRGG